MSLGNSEVVGRPPPGRLLTGDEGDQRRGKADGMRMVSFSELVSLTFLRAGLHHILNEVSQRKKKSINQTFHNYCV